MNTLNEEIKNLQNQLLQVTLEKQKLDEKLTSVIQKNDAEFKTFTHELAGAIQILILSVDSIEHNPTKDMTSNLERIKRASKSLVLIINKVRDERKKDLGLQVSK